MGEMKESICKGCGVKMYWAKSPNGKMIPLVKVRTVYAYHPNEPLEVLQSSEVFYINHFETCPKASEF